MLFSKADILQRIDDTTLLYLCSAGALLLLRQAKTFAFGDLKVEFEQIREIAEQAKQTAEVAEDAARFGLGQPQAEPAGTEQVLERPHIEPGPIADDPWKGQFGGLAERDQRRLSARVEPFAGSEDWFLVHLHLSSTNPRQPLSGPVEIFLHPTFARQRISIDTPPSGIIELRLKAWGAFTVGVLIEHEQLLLELDLAELEDAPAVFRSR
ncbi:pYEATS domain-containing protein [Pseudomonas sp. BMS12]|uniref:pYEATS domain-containing protein n=1 Tax=Pseudomonas sp. BMS12 TaxID=1796033 RepID=UPI00083B8BD2|nr:pYEATS domain-containing protein [Pseudomonas sp. BMS12]